MSHQPSKNEPIVVASWNKMFERVRSHQNDNAGAIYLNAVADIHSELLAEALQAKDAEREKAVEEERERIEEVFKKQVPPHPLSLEDGVWLKRLLNKAFNHK